MLHTPEELAKLTEDEFRRKKLIPLLRIMGMLEVEHTHGPNELGKDVVFWKHEAGIRTNFAIVAKRGRINAQASGDVATVATQVRQAFGAKFLNKTSCEEQSIHRVIVAASGPISPEARKAIRAAIGVNLEASNTDFWDAGKIVEMLNRHLPKPSVPASLEAIRQRLGRLEYFEVVPEIRPESVFYHVTPKSKGTLIAKGVFSFPETPEGEVAMQALQRFFEEGTAAVIPGAFIASFDQHEELTQLFGDEAPGELHIGPTISGPPRDVRLELIGPGAPLAYDGLKMRLLRSGSRRAEFETDERDPVYLSLVFEPLGSEETTVSVSLRFSFLRQSVRRAFKAVRFADALAEGVAMRLVDVETGGVLISPQTVSSARPVDSIIAQYLENLVAIEDRLGWEFNLPEALTNRDFLDARELREILKSGRLVRSFKTYTVTLTPKKDLDLTSFFPPGETRWIRVTGDRESYEILDREAYLGPVQITLPVVVTKEEHERLAAQMTLGLSELKITFSAPPDGGEVRTEYLDLLPTEKSELEGRDGFLGPAESKDWPEKKTGQRREANSKKRDLSS
ncbi:MAG: hypothetical protein AAFX41_11105 [Bacteroidota bacterium]